MEPFIAQPSKFGGINVLFKMCMEMDELSLLRSSACCTMFNQLIFSYPQPVQAQNETSILFKERIKKWEIRDTLSQEIWNNCFQKFYKSTIKDILISLEVKGDDYFYAKNLLRDLMGENYITKMRKNISVDVILRPTNGYEKIKACLFTLKLNRIVERIEKEFKNFTNIDRLELKFQIPAKIIVDKLSLILFEKDYQKFKQTDNVQCLERWKKSSLSGSNDWAAVMMVIKKIIYTLRVIN